MTNPNELQALAETMAGQSQTPVTTVDVPQSATTTTAPATTANQPKPKKPKLADMPEMQWLASVASLFGCLWLTTAPLLFVSSFAPISHVVTFAGMGSLGLMAFLAIRDQTFTLYHLAWLLCMATHGAQLINQIAGAK